MKSLILLFCFLCTLPLFAGTVDPILESAMLQKPDAVFHVLAFFTQKLSPQQVIDDLSIRGDKNSMVQQVVDVYKNKSQEQGAGIFEFCKERAQESLQKLTLHELIQAVSFQATPEIIHYIAQRPEIEKVCLYSYDMTKPDEFFLTPQYYQIQRSILVREGDEIDTEITTVPNREETSVDWEKVVNILKKVYEFVKENKPVVNTSVDQACAIPQGITNWQQMAEWRNKQSSQYVIKYVNGFGVTVVEIVTKAYFYYNGSYQGKGRYITCATASIDKLNVLWGYTLNASVKIPDSGIVNMGTTENPIAGMRMVIHWIVDTLIQHQEGTLTFSLDGTGNVSGS